MVQNPVVIIPARLASERFPRKPLVEIDGEPMVLKTWRQAIAADLGPVYVACCSPEIAAVIHQAGGEAILTDPKLPSGTDRIWAALQQKDPHQAYDAVLNLQGDLPLIAPEIIRAALKPLQVEGMDIGTVAAEIHGSEGALNPDVVKIAMSPVQNVSKPFCEGVYQAHYFSRSLIPANAASFYKHVGIYAYRRAALQRFVTSLPTALEKMEKLEQLRALENGLRIGVSLIDTVPVSVDRPEDLDQCRPS